MCIDTKLTFYSGLTVSWLSALTASILMSPAKSKLWHLRNINGRLPLCNFLLYALKPVIQTSCLVANKGMFCSFLLNSLAAYQTACFVCLLYFCLILIPDLSEPGAAAWAWHCPCQSLDLGYNSIHATKCKKNPNQNQIPHISFIRADLILR